tara:strand:+ start:2788 stop:3543 length:756 start_codon:yes stop_codon:yes gene_type:complete
MKYQTTNNDKRPPVIIPKGLSFKFHGNFGGPGNDMDKKPVDALDKAFKKHDEGYNKNGYGDYKSDMRLVKDIDNILDKGNVDKATKQKATMAKAFFKNFKVIEKEYLPAKKVVICTDGGSRGNPGPSAVGYTIKWSENNQDKERYGAKYIGNTTNNVAEYVAVITALNDLQKSVGADAGKMEVEIRSDSQLMVKQLDGTYSTKDKTLRMLKRDIEQARAPFKGVNFVHVKRKYNKEADKLVNEALDNEFNE